MPSVSDRVRRPMDESMLLRLVVVSGLMRGSDLAKFYGEGAGGLDGSRSLEEFLIAGGVDPEQLKVVKRAYVETSDFGSTLIEGLRARHAAEQEIRSMRKALNVCETDQLLCIKRGEAPLPIGEMLVERGLLSRAELQNIIRQQGMITKIERYSSEARVRATLVGRLRLRELRERLRGGRAAALLLGAGLALVILVNLWLTGAFGSAPDLFSRAGSPAQHARNVQACYGNMLAELRRRQVANAEYYRGQLHEYFQRLDRAKITLDDPEAGHVRGTYPALDFGALEQIPARELPRLSGPELEKRLLRTP